jgi:outer membrane protein, adhesin transport system
MKSRYYCYTVCLFFLCLFITSPAQGETLREAVQHMLTTNPDVKTISYNRLARDQEVLQARSGYLPQLDFIAGIGIQDIDTPVESNLTRQEYTLLLRQNLFTGFATQNEMERQRSRVNSSAYLVRSTSENTALITSKVYLDVLRHQELHELAQENLRNHERILDQIKLRSESGLDSKADMSQITGRLSLAQSNVVVTTINVADSKTTYNAVVGHMPDNLVKPESPDTQMPESLDDAQENALENHPTLKSANSDYEARKAQDRVAEGNYYPIIDLELEQNWEDNVDGFEARQEEFIAMLRVRFNLFRGLTDKARNAETAHLVSEAREIRNNTHRQVIESIRLSWMSYQSMLKQIHYREQHVEAAAATTTAYTKQFNIGKRTLLDVLDSEAELIDSKEELLKSQYDGLYAQFRILNGLGNLVHSMELKWPEEAEVSNEDYDDSKEIEEPTANESASLRISPVKIVQSFKKSELAKHII